MNKIKILATLGPSSSTPEIIAELDNAGVDIFRINLSYTKIKDLDIWIFKIINCTNKPICLDTKSFYGNDKSMLDKNIQPVITENDEMCIKMGVRYKFKYYALSFCRNKSSVEYFRSLVGKNVHIIAKIENTAGVKNLDEILEVTDSILIDRGDLSREVPLTEIPYIQKAIIKKANDAKVTVYVATNFFESMVKNKIPTIAETNDAVNTLLDGADGLVLAAETAIGKYPVECVKMVSKIIKGFNKQL